MFTGSLIIFVRTDNGLTARNAVFSCFFVKENANQKGLSIIIEIMRRLQPPDRTKEFTMPTTYAHWRFGDVAMKKLPEDLRGIIERYRDLFDIGVHGPDIFFYYDCLKSNEVSKYGTWMHNTPMGDHLEMFKKNYASASNKEATLAYLLGFLAHFTLDSYCHGYIDHKAEEEGPTHGKIESQYDRHLLIKDGYDPIKTNVASSLHPSFFNSAVIAHLFDRWNEKDIHKTTKDQVFYLNLLWDNSDLKRWILVTGMNVLGVQKYLDLLLTKEAEESCVSSNMRLDKYFEKAAEHYPQLAENMVAYLNDGGELDPYFRHNFGPKEDYKEIPLLSSEEELHYEAGIQK